MRVRGHNSWIVAAVAIVSLVMVPFIAQRQEPASAAPPSKSLPRYMTSLGGPGHADIYPSGMDIAPDGTVVVADTGNSMIKKYTVTNDLLWAVGGPGSGIGQFGNPRDLAVDDQGNIYVADSANLRVVKLNASGGWITSWTGPSTQLMGTPMGIDAGNGLIYVADAGKKRVRVFDQEGRQEAVLGSQGDCVLAPLRDVAADDSGNIYVANYTANDILKLSPGGTCLLRWGTMGTGAGQFKNPYGVVVAEDPVLGSDRVYVADSNNNRIQAFDSTGTHVATIGQAGAPGEPGTFTGLRRVAAGPAGDVWGADMWGWSIEHFLPVDGSFSFVGFLGGVPPPLAPTRVFNEVHAVAFSPDGTANVIDTVNQRIVRMDGLGRVLGACGERGFVAGKFNWPTGVAVDPLTGQLWVADTKQSRIQIMEPDCSNPKLLGSLGAEAANFNWPGGIAIRSSDRTAWIADTSNHRIKSYDVASRSVIATFGTQGGGLGQFRKPSGIAIDPATGNVLVADTANDRVVELSDTGGRSISVVRTYTPRLNAPEAVAALNGGRIAIADTGDSEVVVLRKGDVMGLLTAPGGFDHPADLAVDASGRLYVSDTLNDKIHVFE